MRTAKIPRPDLRDREGGPTAHDRVSAHTEGPMCIPGYGWSAGEEGGGLMEGSMSSTHRASNGGGGDWDGAARGSGGSIVGGRSSGFGGGTQAPSQWEQCGSRSYRQGVEWQGASGASGPSGIRISATAGKWRKGRESAADEGQSAGAGEPPGG